VMAVGALFAFRGRRAVALGTSVFAALGTCVGITAITASPGPKSVPDLTYHGLILTTLIVGIVLMVRSRQALSRS
jgi:branched-subunit amino acid permease